MAHLQRCNCLFNTLASCSGDVNFKLGPKTGCND